jgi:hypothetical protein
MEEVDWFLCSMVGWNLVVPFIVPSPCSDMYFYLLFC